MLTCFIKRQRAALRIAPAVFAALISPVLAQTCTPGPDCAQIGSLVQQYIAGSGSPSGGAAVANSAMKAYCINKVAAEASRACASEFAKLGRGACADLATQQKNEFLRTAESAQAASVKSSDESRWKELCGW